MLSRLPLMLSDRCMTGCQMWKPCSNIDTPASEVIKLTSQHQQLHTHARRWTGRAQILSFRRAGFVTDDPDEPHFPLRGSLHASFLSCSRVCYRHFASSRLNRLFRPRPSRAGALVARCFCSTLVIRMYIFVVSEHDHKDVNVQALMYKVNTRP